MNTTNGQQQMSQSNVMQPGTPIAALEQPFDLWLYIRILRSRMLIVILTIVAVLGVVAFVTLRTPKVYRATTVIRIETRAPQVLGRDVEDVVEMGPTTFYSNLEYYETQYRIIESRDVAARVVNELALHQNPDFLGVPEEERADWEPWPIEDTAKLLQRMTSVTPIQDSRLAEIHIESTDRFQAQLLANTIAKSYVDRNLEVMLKNTIDAVDWLAKQLDDARSLLSESESALFEFKEEKDILSISLQDRQNILTAQMTAAATNLTRAQSKRIELQANKAAISKVAGADDPMKISLDALNKNLLIQNLKQRYADLSQEHGELSSRYGAKFPKMIEVKAKMTQIREDIDREVKNVLRAVDAELSAARATEIGLKGVLDELRQKAHSLGKNELSYNRLARDKETNTEVYQLLLGRSKEADLSKLLRVNNVQILDPALLPEIPFKPRVKLNLFLALIFGTILGVGLAFLLEFADRTIKTQEDTEALGVSFLGIIPSIGTYSKKADLYGRGSAHARQLKRKRKRQKTKGPAGSEDNFDTFVHDHPKSQISEAYRSVRTNILFMSADNPVKTLLVTSPSPQEGKTTVTCNLSIAMAQSGSRVLLIDTDMRRPRVHKAFGINRPEKGLSTLILGESTSEDSIQSTQIPGLDVLVCGPIPPNPAELLHTESFERVVQDLSQRYDRLLFDSPPVALVTDAAILSKLVDGTVIVLRSQQTTRDSSKHAISKLKDIEANIMGTVLNNLDLTNRKYSRYFYDYYHQYGVYTAEDRDSKESFPPPPLEEA